MRCSTLKLASDSIAAVDLGSNSFHMKIARAYEGELLVLDRMREMVKLGAGIDAQGQLTSDAQQRALAALARFGERLRPLPRQAVRVVGTNALRRAENRDEFLRAAERVLGFPIEIISGEEEARLIYLGVAHTMADNDMRRLVADIGGGSTELIIGERAAPGMLQSLELGCVTLSRQFFEEGQFTGKRWQRALDYALETLKNVDPRVRGARWRQVVGASGTVRAIHQAIVTAKWGTDCISRTALENIVQVLIDGGHVNVLKTLDINAERADVLPGGLAILFALFESLEIEEMRVSDGALREGLLYDMLGWAPDEDTCSASVAALAARFHVDTEQAARVGRTAIVLYHHVARDWNISGPEHERRLAWAAQLHEIGMDIASGQYHKHGAYIVENADLEGFGAFDRRLLGLLVRAQRGKVPWGGIKELPDEHAHAQLRLAILLRLAVILHRNRSREPAIALRLLAAKDGIQIEIPKKNLSQRPLLRADLEDEIELLKNAGIRAELELV